MKRVLDTIALGMRNAAPVSILSLAQNIQPQVALPLEDTSEDMAAAMDFIESF